MGKKTYTPREEYTDTADTVPEVRDAEQAAGTEGNDGHAALSSSVSLHKSSLIEHGWNENDAEVYERLKMHKPPISYERAWLANLLGKGGHLQRVRQFACGPVSRGPLALDLLERDPAANEPQSEVSNLIACAKYNAGSVLAEIEEHQIQNALES